MRANRDGDRRILKTKKLLHEALAALIREKPYDSIVVQDILDRANVGRSTFYTHYRDKDELLVSSIEDLLRPLDSQGPAAGDKPGENLIGFSLPIFQHIHQHRSLGAGRMGPRGRAILHEHLQRVLASRIAGEIRRSVRGRRRPSSPFPQDLLASYIAATFILVLNWWVESKSPLAPKQVDGLFHALAWPTLASLGQ